MSDSDLKLVEQAAIRLLSYREHSRLQLERKLRSRDYSADLIDEVLNGLQQNDLLSEDRFAEEYVASRCRKGFGPVRIRGELRERGIGDGLIGRYLDGVEWSDRVRLVHKKKYGTTAPLDIKEKSSRIRFLQYRGFTSEQIRMLAWSDD